MEFVSKKLRRRETALKNDSWIVGREEEADEVSVVLFLELVVLVCVLWGDDIVGGGMGVSAVVLVVFEMDADDEDLNVESCGVMDSAI